MVIAALLPEELNKALNPLREKFEKGVSTRIPPHISLTFPFVIRNNSEELWTVVKRIGEEKTKFSAMTGRVSRFTKPNGRFVIYWEIRPEEPFQEIYNILTLKMENLVTYDKSFFEEEKLPAYNPHVTLAIDALEEAEETARAYLVNYQSRTFEVPEVVALGKEENEENFKIYEHFPLGKGTPLPV